MTGPGDLEARGPPPRVDHDQALKRVLTRAHDGLLQLLAPDLRWRGEHSPELPPIQRRADLVWEVARPSGQRGLAPVELQNAVDDGLGERLREYAIRLWVRAHVPRSPFAMGWDELQMLRHDIHVVRLWDVPQERIVGYGARRSMPLASLMAGATAETILAVAEKTAAPAPIEERRGLTGLLAMLATRRIPCAAVQEVLRRNRMLPDQLAEGSEAVELWREQGRKARLEEGRREGERMIVQGAPAVRFAPLPDDVTAALHQVDEATLPTLSVHLSSESLQQIRRRLGLGRL